MAQQGLPHKSIRITQTFHFSLEKEANQLNMDMTETAHASQ